LVHWFREECETNVPKSSATHRLSILVAQRHVEREQVETGDIILLLLLDSSSSLLGTLVDDLEGKVVEHLRSLRHRLASAVETLGDLPEGAADAGQLEISSLGIVVSSTLTW
jgi:hypothetical protein